ncbi:MAG: L-seryl-tRNA(Sec) selenium transferase [Tissierellia bacterium]|nr:L-seryl-tRNA(Sec) selenium transferase [Tissierellia bacterium]
MRRGIVAKKELFRQLPSIDGIIQKKKIQDLMEQYSEKFVKEQIRLVVDGYRKKILNLPDNGVLNIREEEVIQDICQSVKDLFKPSFVRTLNGTGTVVHTNLGRSLLAKEAVDHMMEVSTAYSNLEYDIKKGERGSRYNIITEILTRITGAEDALIVNNNAAAVFLMLNSMAKGKETIVSRGELVEIGDSFRISSIMEESGTNLVEVGATNKTHLYDYENEISEDTAVLMKVHTSNFKILGFHESVSIEELVLLGEKYNIPVVEDLGSGTLIDFTPYGLSPERTVMEALEEGADLVSFSGDKILGGPQAGIIVGKKKYIDALKKNQLLRAFRVDKFTLAALESTLLLYLDPKDAMEKIPTLRLMTMDEKKLQEKAEKLKEQLSSLDGLKIRIIDGVSTVGGGAFPMEELPTKVIAITSNQPAHVIEEKLRLSSIHLIGMIREEEYLLDIRCLFEEDFEKIKEVLENILEDDQ